MIEITEALILFMAGAFSGAACVGMIYESRGK